MRYWIIGVIFAATAVWLGLALRIAPNYCYNKIRLPSACQRHLGLARNEMRMERRNTMRNWIIGTVIVIVTAALGVGAALWRQKRCCSRMRPPSPNDSKCPGRAECPGVPTQQYPNRQQNPAQNQHEIPWVVSDNRGRM